MLIGKLVELSGLSKDGLRHYESLGLIHSKTVQAGSRQYRDYDDSTLERLSLIALGKRLHFPLRDIAEFLNRLLRDEITREERSAVLLQKVSELDVKIEDLRLAQQELLALADAPDKHLVDVRLRKMGLLIE